MITLEEKNAFAARLRSGEFVKIKHILANQDNGRCVLGVLCEVFQRPRDIQVLYARRIAMQFFWRLNDEKNLSFAAIADIVDRLDVDDPVFNSDSLFAKPGSC